MAALTHLDTHVVVWLYIGDPTRLSAAAHRRIREDELAISPMALLELTYLQEVGRLRVDAGEVHTSLVAQLGLRLDESPFAEVVATAQDQTWTRDPSDRLISAQAVTAGAALVTADGSMLANVPGAVW